MLKSLILGTVLLPTLLRKLATALAAVALTVAALPADARPVLQRIMPPETLGKWCAINDPSKSAYDPDSLTYWRNLEDCGGDGKILTVGATGSISATIFADWCQRNGFASAISISPGSTALTFTSEPKRFSGSRSTRAAGSKCSQSPSSMGSDPRPQGASVLACRPYQPEPGATKFTERRAAAAETSSDLRVMT
jgi:hypothetical protein